jgi:hypothetical protein
VVPDFYRAIISTHLYVASAFKEPNHLIQQLIMIRRVTSVEIMELFMVKTTALHVILDLQAVNLFKNSAKYTLWQIQFRVLSVFYKIDSKLHSD